MSALKISEFEENIPIQDFFHEEGKVVTYGVKIMNTQGMSDRRSFFAIEIMSSAMIRSSDAAEVINPLFL